MGELSEAVRTLKEDVREMRDAHVSMGKDIAAIRELMANAKGGWVALTAVGGIGAAVVAGAWALVTKLAEWRSMVP
jgi:hypothetical protein